MQISITKALNELKLYDSKITKAVSATFVGAAKKSDATIDNKTKEDFKTFVKANYESVTKLIDNRAKIKSAIVQSNAVTKVNVNGIEMTVAEAIERKSSIDYEKSLLYSLKEQYVKASAKIDRENMKVASQIDSMLNAYASGDSDKKNSSEAQKMFDSYKEKNEFELVDGIKIEDKIKALEDDILGFEAEINTVLVVSNSITLIDVNLD